MFRTKEELKAEIARLDESIAGYRRHIEASDKAIRGLQDSKEALTIKCAKYEETIARLRKDYDNENALKKGALSAVNDLQQRIKELTHVDLILKDIKTCMTLIPEQLNTRIAELETELGRKTYEVEELTSRLGAFQPLLEDNRYLAGKVEAYETALQFGRKDDVRLP